ncbi:hypothetical protein TWF481_006034 [Arthrobotrys musiformis]|uniref:Peptidase S8/S53 domain-containing protein n=1 Tax=Arthrobotrys musiformis TaxID=47236 RepID=A0AAV9WGQ3_9PEZI
MGQLSIGILLTLFFTLIHVVLCILPDDGITEEAAVAWVARLRPERWLDRTLRKALEKDIQAIANTYANFQKHFYISKSQDIGTAWVLFPATVAEADALLDEYSYLLYSGVNPNLALESIKFWDFIEATNEVYPVEITAHILSGQGYEDRMDMDTDKLSRYPLKGATASKRDLTNVSDTSDFGKESNVLSRTRTARVGNVRKPRKSQFGETIQRDNYVGFGMEMGAKLGGAGNETSTKVPRADGGNATVNKRSDGEGTDTDDDRPFDYIDYYDKTYAKVYDWEDDDELKSGNDQPLSIDRKALAAATWEWDLYGIDNILNADSEFEAIWHRNEGKGSVVYVLDSGVDFRHREFDHIPQEIREAGPYKWASPYPVLDQEEDRTFHGTQVVSKIVGKNGAFAHQATVKVIKQTTIAHNHKLRELQTIDGLIKVYNDASLKHFALQRPVIVNISMNFEAATEWFTEALIHIFRALKELGNVLVVTSAGNGYGTQVNEPPASIAAREEFNRFLIVVGGAEADSMTNEFQLAPYMHVWGVSDALVPGTPEETAAGKEYVLAVGTSFAAPQISGLLAYWGGMGMRVDQAVRALYEYAYVREDSGGRGIASIAYNGALGVECGQFPINKYRNAAGWDKFFADKADLDNKVWDDDEGRTGGDRSARPTWKKRDKSSAGSGRRRKEKMGACPLRKSRTKNKASSSTSPTTAKETPGAPNKEKGGGGAIVIPTGVVTDKYKDFETLPPADMFMTGAPTPTAIVVTGPDGTLTVTQPMMDPPLLWETTGDATNPSPTTFQRSTKTPTPNDSAVNRCNGIKSTKPDKKIITMDETFRYTYRYANRDLIVQGIKEVCARRPTTKQSDGSWKQLFYEGSPEAFELDLVWDADYPSKQECLDNFTQILDDCDNDTKENSWEWKGGGTRKAKGSGAATYQISTPYYRKPPAAAWGACYVNRKWYNSKNQQDGIEHVIRGYGWSDAVDMRQDPQGSAEFQVALSACKITRLEFKFVSGPPNPKTPWEWRAQLITLPYDEKEPCVEEVLKKLSKIANLKCTGEDLEKGIQL